MNVPKKKMITLTMGTKIQNKVDHYLDQQYAAWRNNYSHQSISSRLSQDKKSNNQLLIEYIRYIYQQYQIRDPLQTSNNKQAEYSTPIRHKMPGSKFIKKLQYHDSPHKVGPGANIAIKLYPSFETPKYSQSSMRSSKVIRLNQLATTHKKTHTIYNSLTKHQNQKINRFSQEQTLQNTARKHNEINLMSNHREKPPVYKSVQLYKPHFSRVVKFSNPEDSLNASMILNNSGDKNNTQQKLDLSMRMSRQNKPEKIKQSYRYCLGCECAIIQFNIQSHQKQCEEFQYLYSKNLSGMLKHIQQKIMCSKDRIKQSSGLLQNTDGEQFRKYSDAVRDEAQKIVNSGQMTDQFQYNYDKSLQVGKKWVNVVEQINKIRWYVKVRNQIKKKFQI